MIISELDEELVETKNGEIVRNVFYSTSQEYCIGLQIKKTNLEPLFTDFFIFYVKSKEEEIVFECFSNNHKFSISRNTPALFSTHIVPRGEALRWLVKNDELPEPYYDPLEESFIFGVIEGEIENSKNLIAEKKQSLAIGEPIAKPIDSNYILIPDGFNKYTFDNTV